jgi:signal transduction histidine kinase
MKKYDGSGERIPNQGMIFNWLILGTVVFYLAICGLTYWVLVRENAQNNRAYLVEVNELVQRVSEVLLTYDIGITQDILVPDVSSDENRKQPSEYNMAVTESNYITNDAIVTNNALSTDDTLTTDDALVTNNDFGTTGDLIRDLSLALDTKGMQYVTSAVYITREALNTSPDPLTFFSAPPGMLRRIEPIMAGDVWAGYLRVDYLEGNEPYPHLAGVMIVLAGTGIFTLIVLLYLRSRLIKPFRQFCTFPIELAKGHLEQDIPEFKSRYFGKFVWAISMLRDSLKSAKEQSLRLEREKKLLVLSISHDIKTPVNTIRLYAKAITEGIYQGEDIYKAARRIYTHTIEIENFVSAIRTASSQNLLPDEIPISEFYFRDFMEKAKEYFAPKCELLHTTLTVDPYDNVMLLGNPEYALRSMENIMENAFKYGDGAWIHISFWEEDNCRLMQIRNSGTSVAETDMPHLFDSFYRGQNALETTGKEGNGLGLYIAREILRKMEGDVYAKRENNGMSFVMVFRR